ncbi:putative Late competence development protein ComFB [Vibrio nigripulchritudo SOn1]|uniref:Late competence development protein ComFB n=1 Tax=Vibrio nigripulchritudo SOn1 TaxID=1238450 RepID=A0AAV2VNM0_9VIBR|nr:late competence development ComFB family protein [Vibrio nigripulchritudo]CCO46053.1 putative Late competence development protein ComFB [Vibrio nigripulchritudo SOn1]
MKISVDVHNYMETLVGNRLSDPDYADAYDSEQLADLACIALNQLRPIYIRHDIDFLSALPEERLVVLRKQVNDALQASESMIKDDRRRRTEDNVPVVFTKPRRHDDDELEWYEVPILKKKDD